MLRIPIAFPSASGMETKTVGEVPSGSAVELVKQLISRTLAIDRRAFYISWNGRPLLDEEKTPEELSVLSPLELRLRAVGGGTAASAPRPKSSSSTSSSASRPTSKGVARASKRDARGPSATSMPRKQGKATATPANEDKVDGTTLKERGTRTLTELRDALAEDAHKITAEMQAKNLAGLDFQQFTRVVSETCTKRGMAWSSSQIKELFNSLDKVRDGQLTSWEILAGLDRDQNGKFSVQGWQVPASLLHACRKSNMGILDKVAELMVEHKQANTDAAPAALIEQLSEEDLRRAWRKAEDWVVSAFKQHVNVVKSAQGPVTVEEFSSKFADTGTLMKGVYGDLKDEFRSGVEGALGLPGKDIFDGMKIEFTASEDSQTEFTTTNGGGTSTTPQLEYEFVVSPSMDKTYPGERTPTPLKHYLYAACAYKANSDTERFDSRMELLSDEMRDGVKVVLLQRVKELGLAHRIPWLNEAASKDPRLAGVAQRSISELQLVEEAIRKMLKAAGAPRIRTRRNKHGTREGRFEQIAKAVSSEELGVSVEELDALLEATREELKGAGLLEEELIALRLYTGPAYMKMNNVLRAARATDSEEAKDSSLKQNNYVNTIFAAVSGMVKLAEISPIPPGREVYRGLQGMSLPKWLEHANAQGVKGGVELAFLSTSTNIDIAKSYAKGGDLPIVFSIAAGAVDKGAALGFVSQYPNEGEILMPPRSFLEVVGEVTVDATSGVISVPVKLNCNLFCPTLEKLRASRMETLVNTLKHMRKEIARDVDEMLAKDEVVERAKEDIFWNRPGVKEAFAASIKDEPALALKAAKDRKASWYNVDIQFRRAMQEALSVQKKAMGKLTLWVEERSLYAQDLTVKSARECDRMATGRLLRKIEELDERIKQTESGEGSEHDHFVLQRRGVITMLCRHKDLIHKEVDEVLQTNDGETALMLQAAEGAAARVQMLLEAGADVHRFRAGGATAVHVAAEAGHTRVLRVLLDAWGDRPLVKTDKGDSAIALAAKDGHADTCRVLKQHIGAEWWNSANALGWTPVHEAAYDGHLGCLKILLEDDDDQGTAVNTPNNQGFTALMMAAQNGHMEMVRWLVRDKNADVTASSNRGKTAFLCAAEEGKESVLKWLAQQDKVDIHGRSRDGSTALMLVCQIEEERPELSRYLVEEKGADFNAVNNEGRTPLLCAVEKGHEGQVKWLEGRGADVNAMQNNGLCAIILAAMNGHLHLCKWLVDHRGANVNAKTKDKTTALIAAAENGHEHVMRWLVEEQGADVSLRNTKGQTALLAAARTGNLNLVRWLIEERNADITAKEQGDDAEQAAPLQAVLRRQGTVVSLPGDSFGLKSKGGHGGAAARGEEETDSKAQRLQDESSHVTLQSIGIVLSESRGTVLINAAARNHCDLVRWLVDRENPLDLNERNWQGTTALLAAAASGHAQMVQQLVDSNADLKAEENNGRTALMLACLSGNLDLAQWIVAQEDSPEEKRAMVTKEDDQGWTPVLCAAQREYEAAGPGALPLVEWLISQGAEPKKTNQQQGWTVLLGATKNGNLALVQMLVQKHDADVNDKTKDGWTALMLAARSGVDEQNKELVRWLVKNWADVTNVNDNGQTALECAAILGNKEIVDLLLHAEEDTDMQVQEVKAGKGDGTTLLMCAASAGHEELVKWLAREQKIANINEQSKEGNSLLLIAAGCGQLGLVKWLVSASRKPAPADPNLSNSFGETPLMVAASNGHEGLVSWLVQEKEVELEVTDKAGRTALLRAAMAGREAVVRALAKRDANLDAKDEEENSALTLAARNGLEGLLRWLVNEKKADLEHRNASGQTAFICAADEGREGAMRWLSENGADVNAKQEDGQSALMLLVAHEEERLVEWMVQNTGAEVNADDLEGKTPLMHAAERGLVDVAKKLDSGSRERLNVRAKDKRGFTAVMHAVQHGHREMAEWLLSEKGANVDAVNEEGWTPLTLQLAHERTDSNKEFLEYLVTRSRAKVNGVEEAGGVHKVPLSVAIQHHGLAGAKWMVELEANVNAKDTNAVTPLMVAASSRAKRDGGRSSEELVRFLVKHKADVNERDIWGNTALLYALDDGKDMVVRTLLESGAAVERKNELGWNARHLALLTGQQDKLGPAGEGKTEAVQREVEALQQEAPLSVFRGTPLSALISVREHAVHFRGFSTVRCRDPCPSGGKGYYELKVVQPLIEPQFGFATAGMAACFTDTPDGVGDDQASWDMYRVLVTARQEAAVDSKADVQLRKDDVIGLAYDLAKKEMSVSVSRSGRVEHAAVLPMADACTASSTPLFAAFSASAGVVEYNFGDAGEFACSPPTGDVPCKPAGDLQPPSRGPLRASAAAPKKSTAAPLPSPAVQTRAARAGQARQGRDKLVAHVTSRHSLRLSKDSSGAASSPPSRKPSL